MNILFLSENFPPETNAAATRVYERAAYWARWGHDVTVITCAPNFPHGKIFPGYENKWLQTEEMDGIRIVRVKTYIAPNRAVIRRVLDFLSFMVMGFFAALGQKKPDLVTATSPQFFAAVAGWAVGAVRRVPFVFELGDLWPDSISAVGAMGPNPALRLMEKLELFLYGRSACIIALTGTFKENLVSRGIPEGKVAVVINGVDLPRYGPRPRNAELAETWGLEGRFVVGYMGTHGMAHGLSNVLDAAEVLAQEKDIRFLFAGAGAEREALMAESDRRGLKNTVFMPAQPKGAMPEVWSLCDVALVHLKDSPVFAGVIPSKMFEAMGMGLPILLSAPKGEASRIVQADKAGLWVPAEDPGALANAVRSLFKKPKATKAFAERSLKAAPLHGRERQARRMIAVYELAAKGKGGEVGGIEEDGGT